MGADNELPNGAKIFDIDGTTGQISVSGNKPLDFERLNLYELTLKVVDGGGLSATNDLTINIIDVCVPAALARADWPATLTVVCCRPATAPPPVPAPATSARTWMTCCWRCARTRRWQRWWASR